MGTADELFEMIKSLPETKVEMAIKIIKAIKDEVELSTPDTFVSTEEAAEILGLTSATVRTYLMNGKLEGRKLSERKMVVSSESVQKLRLAQTRF